MERNKVASISIHPFPARMAPEIALKHISEIKANSIILDPMAGSGTVLYTAAVMGHRSIGFDLDPLAVLIARVRTSKINISSFADITEYLITKAKKIQNRKLVLRWIDFDEETEKFIKYWFAEKQIQQLRPIAYLLKYDRLMKDNTEISDVLRLCLSRLIITKKRGASLAWDVSHSRPHKVIETNDFDIFNEFKKSTERIINYFKSFSPTGRVTVHCGDARALHIKSRSVDAVITSPPYLNAIDYLRGHKLSLVWFGYKIRDIRLIRSSSIGAERSAEIDNNEKARLNSILNEFGDLSTLPNKHQRMILRYAVDINRFTSEVGRVLKPGGKCVFVVGNSCLKGVFINNSAAISAASRLAGLQFLDQVERELPANNRYLPISVKDENALCRRMRSEIVMSFKKKIR